MLSRRTPARPPEFSSPEVRADRTIVSAPLRAQAKAVGLSSSDLPNVRPFGPGIEMKKSDKGVWEVTVGPVPAGTYRYHFQVDGLAVIDPRNPATSEANANTWSLLTVPGSPVSDLKDVPHGAVAQVPYYSKSLGRFRRMHVYTPPGYEQGSGKLPILYLLHGAFDCDASWSTVGRSGLVLDNLIAAGKARPMIVVMPMGHTGPFRFGPGGSLQKQMEEFVRDFTADVRPAGGADVPRLGRAPSTGRSPACRWAEPRPSTSRWDIWTTTDTSGSSARASSASTARDPCARKVRRGPNGIAPPWKTRT